MRDRFGVRRPRAVSEQQAAKGPPDDAGAREVVEVLLTHLSPDDRLVITLLDLEERSIAQVRDVTGWSESAVKVRAFRARQKLRKHAQQLRMKL